MIFQYVIHCMTLIFDTCMKYLCNSVRLGLNAALNRSLLLIFSKKHKAFLTVFLFPH